MKFELTKAELDAVLWCVGQHTESNARDIDEMMREGLTRNQAKAMLRADDKLRIARYSKSRKVHPT